MTVFFVMKSLSAVMSSAYVKDKLMIRMAITVLKNIVKHAPKPFGMTKIDRVIDKAIPMQ